MYTNLKQFIYNYIDCFKRYEKLIIWIFIDNKTGQINKIMSLNGILNLINNVSTWKNMNKE